MAASLKADFLSSQKALAASLRVLASLQSNLQSWHVYDNLLNIGLTGLSNRVSYIIRKIFLAAPKGSLVFQKTKGYNFSLIQCLSVRDDNCIDGSISLRHRPSCPKTKSLRTLGLWHRPWEYRSLIVVFRSVSFEIFGEKIENVQKPSKYAFSPN